MIKELEQQGLDRSEVEIYLTLIKLGKASVGVLAKKSKIKRTSIYDILHRLIAHGLVSSVSEEGVNYYTPKNPESLLDTISEQEQALSKLLPSLIWVSSNPNIKTKVEYFTAHNTVEMIYADTLKLKGDHFYGIVAGSGEENLEMPYINSYIKKRVANKISMDQILQSTEKINYSKLQNQKQLRNLKLLPANFPIDSSICIYAKNKVAFISYNDTTAVKIIDKQVYNTFKSIYKIAWDSLPEPEL